jgi:hypothetical protein
VIRSGKRIEARLNQKEQIFKRPVVRSAENLGAVQPVQRIEASARRGSRNDSLPRQHQSVGVMNVQKRIKKQSLRISKIVTKDRLGVDGRGKFVRHLPV